MVVKPRFTKENYTEAVDGEIRCDILTVADINISTLIASKQDTLYAGENITILDNIISSSGGGSVSQSDLDLKQDKITASSNLTTGSLTVYTEKIKSSETLDTLIYRLIEQYFSPSYKPTSYVVIKSAVEYFYDNTLGLPEGTNNTQASINNVANWDVSLITALDSVSSFRYDFNENISNWNVSLVTNMNIAFYECYKFNQPIGNWNVSKVTNMSFAFGRCHSFNQNISGWSVSNVKTLTMAFIDCFSYNQPMNNWNVSNVIEMTAMFQGCSVFNQDISNWNVSNATDMRYMFKEAPLFN